MIRYVVRRLLLMVLVLFGMSIITFSMTHLVPGDPARLMAGQRASASQVQAVVKRYGLDRPLPIQYAVYMQGLLRGDLGESMLSRRPVARDMAQYLPATLELTATAVVLMLVAGIPLGVVAAVNRGQWLDHLTRLFTIGCVSMPVFWLGLALQIVFYRWWPVLPIGGRLGILDIPPAQVTGLYLVDSVIAGEWSTFGAALTHLLLPAVTLAAGSVAVVARMMRASMLETLDTDYVRTARAKGLPERIVLGRHALRTALLPTTTVVGLQIGTLLAGNVLIEVVFNWPGLGLYAVNAIRFLDYSAIMGVTLAISCIYVFVNLLVDLLYVVLDPRITFDAEARG